MVFVFFVALSHGNASKLNGELKSSPTTELASEILYENGDKLNYTYDESGNISSVSFNGVLKESYSYDLIGRLKTEQNVESGYLVVYSYDNGGNITSKKKYACQSAQVVTSEIGLNLQEQKTYGYDSVWKDKLINYNGQSIIYDACGNPTNYKGITATWEKGRQLKSFGPNSYKYNASGIRISKTVSGVEHKYTLNGSNVICEEIKDQNITTKLDYLYDIDSSICGMRVNNGEYYFFRKNLQGDIIAITDNVGNIIANYRYDAWGKVLSITGSNTSIANLNPFRYRGYYYDVETQLYYLNSRYYDPEICRFINSDDFILVNNNGDLLQNNLFCYCLDNPICSIDFNGMAALSLYSTAVSLKVASRMLFTAIKAFKFGFWNIFIVVGLCLIVLGLVWLLCSIAQELLRIAEANMDKQIEEKHCYNNTVYFLSREPGDFKKVFYVGRTKNPIKRRSAHKRKKGDFAMYLFKTGLSKPESSVYEQALLTAFTISKLQEQGGGSGNKIRAIAISKVKKFITTIGEIAELQANSLESKILYLQGR